MIHLKKSLNKWIPVDKENKIEFLIDYPNIEQGEKLTEMKYDAIGRFLEYDSNGELINNKMDLVKFLAYKRYLVKCTVKDWKGLDDKCVIEDNELEDELHNGLVRKETQLNLLYDLINAELDFNEDDKKKLDSANGSETTAMPETAEEIIH